MNFQKRPSNIISLAAMLAAVSAPGFADALQADAKPTNLNVVKLRDGLAVATYVNASTEETVRIFVRDAGVIARDLPGEGPTKFRLTGVEPAGRGFLEWYVDGRIWPDIRREYYRPEPWEVLAWGWSAEAVESIAAGALVLREIGKASCKGCGKPHWQHERDDERKVCTDCDKPHVAMRPTPARWNYQPAKAERGTVIVGTVEKPTWWCAGMEGTRRKCVRVTAYEKWHHGMPDEQTGHAFFIDDEDGSGTVKVYERGGGPDSSHRSLPVDDPATFDKADDGPLEPEPQAKPVSETYGVRRKAGRNESCPCGSGEKFKKCCGKP
jgi:hypothetical protein